MFIKLCDRFMKRTAHALSRRSAFLMVLSRVYVPVSQLPIDLTICGWYNVKKDKGAIYVN